MSVELKAIENLVACVKSNTDVCLLRPYLPKEMHEYGIDIVVALDNVLEECKKFRKASLQIPIGID